MVADESSSVIMPYFDVDFSVLVYRTTDAASAEYENEGRYLDLILIGKDYWVRLQDSNNPST